MSIKGEVVVVSSSPVHSFTKYNRPSIKLLKGLGVEGDAHCGEKVKHRYMVKLNPNKPNLCQVHLMAQEWIDELNGRGFHVAGGSMGENITTRGIDLLALPRDTLLRIGKGGAVIQITGLRNPCSLLDKYQKGLKGVNLCKDTEGKFVRKAGIMAIVLEGGEIFPGDVIDVELPPKPYIALPTV